MWRVWLVEWRNGTHNDHCKDCGKAHWTVLSAHTSIDEAYAAAYAYAKHPQYGSTIADFWVHSMELNHVRITPRTGKED